MKTGVFGGAFNPVHNGHVSMAKSAMDTLGLDRLLVIPSGESPHKPSEGLVRSEHRFRMLSLAFEGFDNVRVSDMELRRAGKSYSVDTLSQLRLLYPDDEFFLIVGADMFLSFRKWKDYRQILSLATLCAAARHPDEYERLCAFSRTLTEDGQAIVFCKNVVEISSTQVRESISMGKDFSGLVPQKVCEYIIREGLYR